MAALCIGGVCVPYTAIVPAVLIFLKWVAEQLGFLSLNGGGDTACSTSGAGGTCCGRGAATTGASPAPSTSTNQNLKPRRSKLGKSLSAISNASSCGGGADGTVKEIESADEWRGVVGGKQRPVVVKFTAEWCKPCKSIDPFYRSLARRYDATFVKIDVDEHDGVAADCAVAMMPTFVVFRNGEKAGSVSGAHEDKLEALIEEHCPARVRM